MQYVGSFCLWNKLSNFATIHHTYGLSAIFLNIPQQVMNRTTKH